MQSVIVMPMHDPSGLMFPHLQAVTPQLKEIFAEAFVSVTPITRENQSEYMPWLETEEFFQVLNHQNDVLVGEDFFALYTKAASSCPAHQILHLCFIDRVAFVLQSEYRQAFFTDIQAIESEHTPLIFQRSEKAWATHPHNYYELEQMVTKVGKYLFDKELDFAWPHLVVQAGQLQEILPSVKKRDLSMVAECVLLLRQEMQTKNVDWLAWEDPFIYSRNPQELKKEREGSQEEVRKRLSYVIPMLELLDAAANN